MRERLGTSDLTIVAISGAAMAALTAVSFLIAPVDSTPRVPGSSYSEDRNGSRAAYLVLKELGYDVWRSFEPITALTSDPPTTTLILVNPTESPSQGDAQSLRSFVERGGTVIAFGLSAGAFLPGVGPGSRLRHDRSVETFPAALPGQLTRGARELSAHRTPAPSLDPAYIPVYRGRDTVAVVTARFGAGQIVWCLDETLIQNDGITRGANINLIANLAELSGPRTIAWDEYYHGQRRSFWSYLAGTPLVWGGAQLGVVALVMLATSSRRRGPLHARIVESRASPLEFVDTMASLYERAGDARAAIEAARDRLRRRLARAAGVSVSSTDDHLLALAAPRTGLDPDRTSAALATAAAALRRGVANSEQAVPIVAELQELAAPANTARRGATTSERRRLTSAPDRIHG
jgi:hypothetical protein